MSLVSEQVAGRIELAGERRDVHRLRRDHRGEITRVGGDRVAHVPLGVVFAGDVPAAPAHFERAAVIGHVDRAVVGGAVGGRKHAADERAGHVVGAYPRRGRRRRKRRSARTAGRRRWFCFSV